MTIEDIRTAYYVTPFKPFVVRLSDGRRFLVPKRHYITLSPTGESIIVLRDDAHFTHIAMSNVEAIDPPKRSQYIDELRAEIRAACALKPFQPFVIRLGDGREFGIQQPHHVALSPIDDTISIRSNDRKMVFVKITEVESLELPNAKRPN